MHKHILITSILTSILFTTLALVAIVGFQADLRNLFGISIDQSPHFSVLKDLCLPIFSAFGGAISGAIVAFKLQESRELHKNNIEQNSHLNRTIFSLHMQLTDLLNIKEQMIVPHEQKPLRFLQILPMVTDDLSSEPIKMDFAQTLIDNNNPQLVQEILIAEKQYFNLMRLYQQRNALKIKVDTLLEEKGFNHGSEYGLGDFMVALGPQNLAALYDMTEKYIDLLNEALPYIYSTINKLIAESKSIFKDNSFKRIEFVMDDRFKELLQPLAKPILVSKEKLFEIIQQDLKMKK